LSQYEVLLSSVLTGEIKQAKFRIRWEKGTQLKKQFPETLNSNTRSLERRRPVYVTWGKITAERREGLAFSGRNAKMTQRILLDEVQQG